MTVLADATLLGGGAGLARRAIDCAIVDPARCRSVAAGSVVFLASTDSLATELALPGLYERDAAAVVIDHDVLVSTRWLADRFAIPLLHHGGDRWESAMQVRIHLREPLVERGLRCADAARRLACADSPSAVATVVAGVLGAPVGVLGSSGVVLAGAPGPWPPLPEFSSGSVDSGTDKVIFAATPEGRESGARLMCAVRVPAGVSVAQAETIRAVAELAVLRLSVWAARSALMASWDQAAQGALLTQLMSTGSLDGPYAEQAVALGWKLDGFHLVIAVRPDGDGPDRPATLAALQHVLVAAGVTAPVVAIADGWVWWTSRNRAPNAAQIRLHVNEIRQVIADMSAFLLVAGVAAPAYGVAGLVRAIDDAIRLSRIAGTGAGRRSVETASEANPRQGLLTAVTDDHIRRNAELLLAPLVRSADTELLETLDVYLRCECSTTATATRLGVHRNSVAKRLSRIQALLAVDLADDDTRLALRIACRSR
ncbi:MAG: helix-turn-helix domain-containing protein [Gordonia sp. (in: high G+C Gram-positive bacteria)]